MEGKKNSKYDFVALQIELRTQDYLNTLCTSRPAPLSRRLQMSHHLSWQASASGMAICPLGHQKVGCSWQDEGLPPLGRCWPFNLKVGPPLRAL